MKSKNITAVEVIVIIAIIATLAAKVVMMIYGNSNEQNRITEGIIVDKSYIAERVTTDYRVIENTPQIPFTYRKPAQYYFQLEGEKNEIKVKYWLEVSEHDYNAYRIGDYYKL